MHTINIIIRISYRDYLMGTRYVLSLSVSFLLLVNYSLCICGLGNGAGRTGQLSINQCLRHVCIIDYNIPELNKLDWTTRL